MKTKVYYLILCLCLCVAALSFSSCSDDDEGSSIIGTWASDENSEYLQETWIFKSNGNFESHYRSDWGDQPRIGKYVLNNGMLTINIREIEGNNGAYTEKFVVTMLTKHSLILANEDEIKSFTR